MRIGHDNDRVGWLSFVEVYLTACSYLADLIMRIITCIIQLLFYKLFDNNRIHV